MALKDVPVKKLFPLCLYLGLLLAGVRSPVALAQTPYCNPENSAPVSFGGWPQGQSVPVYIDPGLQGQRRDAVVQAFNNWTNSRGENGSGVVFTFVSAPPPAGTGYTILNQQHPSGNRETTNVVTNDTTGDTMSATTFLSPTMTQPPGSA